MGVLCNNDGQSSIEDKTVLRFVKQIHGVDLEEDVVLVDRRVVVEGVGTMISPVLVNPVGVSEQSAVSGFPEQGLVFSELATFQGLDHLSDCLSRGLRSCSNDKRVVVGVAFLLSPVELTD